MTLWVMHAFGMRVQRIAPLILSCASHMHMQPAMVHGNMQHAQVYCWLVRTL